MDLEAFEPTMSGAAAAIQQVMTLWNKKKQKGPQGKMDKYFHKICGSLDSHSNMLGMLPQNNQYVSIFTGALTTIVQVCTSTTLLSH